MLYSKNRFKEKKVVVFIAEILYIVNAQFFLIHSIEIEEKKHCNVGKLGTMATS